VRSAVVIGPRGDGWAAYFGDFGAYVHSIDALTGRELWTVKVDDHPAAIITGSPTLVGNTLFVPVSSYEEVTGANPSYPCCSFRGSLVALDADIGLRPLRTDCSWLGRKKASLAVIWLTDTVDITLY
jgi:polyvinyl alcohol dehydrogenase (cytochrome)